MQAYHKLIRHVINPKDIMNTLCRVFEALFLTYGNGYSVIYFHTKCYFKNRLTDTRLVCGPFECIAYAKSKYGNEIWNSEFFIRSKFSNSLWWFPWDATSTKWVIKPVSNPFPYHHYQLGSYNQCDSGIHNYRWQKTWNYHFDILLNNTQ